MPEQPTPEQMLNDLGLEIAEPLALPPGVEAPLVMVRVSGTKAYVSGHGPQNSDGTLATHLLGKVGDTITQEQAIEAAQLCALSMLGSLKRELGELDRIKSWNRIFGMVNCTPDFTDQTSVINGFSKIILDVFGKEIGLSTRSAVGMASLPFNISVEVEAELELFK